MIAAAHQGQRVCTIGQWHLGSVVSACLADIGYQVTGVDPNAERIKKLAHAIPPLFEPELAELLQKNLSAGRLAFTTDLTEAARDAEVVLVTYDTPVDANDKLDLTPITETVHKMAALLKPDALVILQSQIPVGTSRQLIATIERLNPNWTRKLACVPENLRLGNAIQGFLAPQMVVIGADESNTYDQVQRFLRPITTTRTIWVDLNTAEMIKHALNAFFATCVSFANELGTLCDEIGADGLRVAEVMRLDERIGPKALVFPGGPFGGGTLARDLKVLQDIGARTGCDTQLIDAVLNVNEHQKDVVVRRLRKLFGEIRGLQVGVLGLTYKAGTSTLRRSPVLDLINRLIEGGAHVRAYDPKADLSELDYPLQFRVCSSPVEVADGVDALVIATEWPEFKDLDFAALRPRLRRPIILDTKNLLVPEQMTSAGFRYFGIGRGTGLEEG